MKLAVISPTKYLDLFVANDNLRINLALAQHILSDPQYASCYKRMAEHGHYVILDNGASELKQAIDSSILFKALQQSGAREVVCPDVLFDAKNTIELTSAFLREYTVYFQSEGISTMAVCQGKSLSEWLSCYQEYQDDDRIDIVGISNTAQLLDNSSEWEHRIKLIQYLKEHSFLTDKSKPIHLLGLGSNGHWEINALSHELSIRSIDTSAPVVHGYFNIRFERDKPYAKNAVTLDINWGFSKEQISAVKHNISILEKAIQHEP